MSVPYEQHQIAVLLRGLRDDAGLTTRAAATLAGFSQPKLSKIETGKQIPSFTDAATLCRVYGAPAARREQILDLLAPLHESMESARVILSGGAYRWQQRLADAEQSLTQYRDIQVAMVSGLLQAPDYIASVMGSDMSAADRNRAVAARLERQRIIDDDAKSFAFVMTEGALRWRTSGVDMAAQVEHIAEMSRRPNVRVGVVPWTATMPAGLFPGHEVHIYDERLVIVGIGSATASIQDPRDITVYVDLFERLEAVATWSDDARAHLERITAEHRMVTE